MTEKKRKSEISVSIFNSKSVTPKYIPFELFRKIRVKAILCMVCTCGCVFVNESTERNA